MIDPTPDYEFVSEPIGELVLQYGSKDLIVWEPYIQRGEKVLFVAPPKTGKTTLIANVVSAMGEGGNLIGEIRPGNVVILTEERKDEWINRRETLNIGNNVFIILSHKLNGVDWPHTCSMLANEAVNRNAHLVIIDPFLNFNDLEDENSATQMIQACRGVQYIVDNTNAAVMVLGHCRKTGGNVIDSVRGSTASPAFFDTIFLMRSGRSGIGGQYQRIIQSVGRRDDLPNLESIELVDGRYEIASATSAQDHRCTISEILAQGDRPMTRPEIQTAWPSGKAKAPGVTHTKTILKAGIEAGDWTVIGTGKSGDPYRYVGRSQTSTCQGSATTDRHSENTPLEAQTEDKSVSHSLTLESGISDRHSEPPNQSCKTSGATPPSKSDRTDRHSQTTLEGAS